MRSQLWTSLVISLALLCCGCGGKAQQLIPTPNLYANGQAEPFTDVGPELQNNHVEVLYLTDRANDDPNGAKYGFKRSRSVAVGIADVEIGKNISWAQLEAASKTHKRAVDLPLTVAKTTELVRFPDTPRILMELNPYQPHEDNPETRQLQAELDAARQKAHDLVASMLAKTPHKEVYIFVHGYNNTFDESILSIANMWHFLGRRGLAIAYSWPAGHAGLLRGYTYDRESSEFTVFHFKQMLRALAASKEVEKINILCHSRGTGVVTTALAELHMEIAGGAHKSTRDELKLGTLVLAAPDIDFDVLLQRAVTVRLGLVPERCALYVCANDKALGISNWLFGGVSRLGSVRSDMFPPEELKMLRESKSVEIMDAKVKDLGEYGHSYFKASPAVSSDIILLMRYHKKAGAESGRPLELEQDGVFWQINDDYPNKDLQPVGSATAPSASAAPTAEPPSAPKASSAPPARPVSRMPHQ